MPDIIPLTGRACEAFNTHFVIAAITRAREEAGIAVPYDSPLQVSLTINGVEVPFVATLEDLWGRMNNDLEARIQDEAKRLLREATTDKMDEMVRDFRNNMEEILDEAFPAQETGISPSI